MGTEQRQVRRLIKFGVIFSLFWLAGIGSAIAVLFGFKARRLIRASGGQLRGNSGAWWCLISGGLGLLIWIPIITIGVFNNITK